MDHIFRHLAACNNAVLPGERLPLHASGAPVGWVRPALVPALLDRGAERRGDAIELAADRLQEVARSLAEAGAFRWRGEAFDIRADPDGPVLAVLDRGALPSFGVRAVGAHLNGLVRRDGAWFLWVARRAANKQLDPGKLDHIAAGGVPAGLTPQQTMVKEAEEEAGLPPTLMRDMKQVGIIEYTMERPEGLRRDRVHCYDLVLPPDFTPEPRDGEVAGFELWPMQAVLDRVRETDDFKFNVNLVLIDLFRRHGLLPPL